jgi:hypothetical protein
VNKKNSCRNKSGECVGCSKSRIFFFCQKVAVLESTILEDALFAWPG